MSNEYLRHLDPRRRRVVSELIGIVTQHYPTASFAIGPAEVDPNVTHITTTVDLDDPDEVVDLVIERMLELQIDEEIPVYVIPIRTPERTLAILRRHSAQQRTPALPLPLPPI